MPEKPITVRDVFELPEPGAPEESSPRWQSLRDWMSKEVSSIKTARVPDLTSKVAELLEVPIPDILMTSWKKTNILRDVLAESKTSPDTTMYLELGEHTINSQHRPHIEVRIQKKTIKNLEFVLRLVFKLKGFILRVQNGAVTEMETGTCEMQGKLEFQGLVVAEKKLAPIKLPGRIPLERVQSLREPDEPKATVDAPSASPAETSTNGTPAISSAAIAAGIPTAQPSSMSPTSQVVSASMTPDTGVADTEAGAAPIPKARSAAATAQPSSSVATTRQLAEVKPPVEAKSGVERLPTLEPNVAPPSAPSAPEKASEEREEFVL